jgi:hypothetical protein
MAPSTGFTGKGTIFSMGPAATFTTVGQIKTIQFNGQKWSFDDVTNLNSPAVGVGVLEEALPAKMAPGELAIGGIFLPNDAGQEALNTAFQAGTLENFKVQLPMGPGQTTAGNLYAFSGYVQEFPAPDVQFDKIVNFKVTIKLSTVITLTQGS